MKKIITVILAAGKSSRFKSTKSKIFQELAGIPIIEHVHNMAITISNDIIFVCNPNNIQDLKKKFPKCKFVIQKKQKGTADAIICAKKYLKKSNVLILFGDVPLISSNSLKKLINNFKKNNSIGSMIAFKSNKPYGYGRVNLKENKIFKIIEELNATNEEKKNKLCNSGVLICNSDLLFSNINKISNRNIKKEKYLPDIFQIFNKIGKSFSYILSNEEEMLGINTIKDFYKVDKIYQEKLIESISNKGVFFLDPQNTRVSYDTKISKGVKIEPYVYLKLGVSIDQNSTIKSHSIIEKSKIGKNTLLGPYARIRPSSIIGNYCKIGNYVEIKNSIIGHYTSISHLSYIGDSRVGNKVNIGAGAITCNYDGKKKNKTVIKDNVFIGSNSSLVAPITINKNSTIAAGSVITRDVGPNNLAIERSNLKILRKLKKK